MTFATTTETAATAAATAARSSFYWPMRLLPAARRNAAFAIYRFCRAVDDIADGDGPAEARRAGLAAWRSRLDRLYGGAPDAADAGLAAAVRRFALPRAPFDAIIDGMLMDVDGAPDAAGMIAPDMATLRLYCSRVAGAVGLLLVRIFADDRRPDDDAFALALGEALQLTNILRDIDEDAALGRLYLPQEALAAAGIATADPAAALRHPDLPQACHWLAAQAERRFADAAVLLAGCGRRRLWPAAAMMTLYRRLLDRMVARGWDGPRRRPRLTGRECALAAIAAACGWGGGK